MIRVLFEATPREQAWSRAVFQTLFPTCADVDLERFTRERLAAIPAPAAVGLRVAVAVVTISPAVLLRRPVLFGQLSGAQRLDVLERFGASDVYLARSIFTILKATGAMACASAARLQGRRR